MSERYDHNSHDASKNTSIYHSETIQKGNYKLYSSERSSKMYNKGGKQRPQQQVQKRVNKYESVSYRENIDQKEHISSMQYRLTQLQKTLQKESQEKQKIIEENQILKIQLDDVDNEINKRQVIIDKQKEYIQLVDDELIIFKKIMRAEKDEIIKQQSIEIQQLKSQMKPERQRTHSHNKVAQAEMESLKRQINEYQQQKSELLTAIQMKDQQILDFHGEKQLLAEEVFEKKESLKKSHNIIQKYDQQLLELNRSVQQAFGDNQHQNLNDTLIAVKQKELHLIEKLKLTEQTKTQQYEQLQMQIQEIEEEKERLMSENASSNELIRELEEQKKLDDQLINSLQQSLFEVSEESKQLQFQVDELIRKTKTITDLVFQIKVLEEEKNKDEQCVKELKQKLGLLEKEFGSFQIQITKLNQELIRKNHQIQNEQQKTESLKEGEAIKLMKMKVENEKLNQEYQDQQNHIQKLQSIQKDYIKIKTDYDQMVLHNKEFRQQNDQLKAELKVKSDELSNLGKQVSSIHQKELQFEEKLNQSEQKQFEVLQSLKANTKKMVQVKVKVGLLQKGVEQQIKKMGLAISTGYNRNESCPIPEEDAIGDLHILIVEMFTQIDLINEWQRLILSDFENKSSKDNEKNRSLVQQNMQLKVELHRIEELSRENTKLHEEINDMKKEKSFLKIDNQNLQGMVRRESVMGGQSLNIPIPQKAERRQSIQTNHHDQTNPTNKLQSENTQLKREIAEAHEIIQHLQSGDQTKSVIDKQINHLNKRLLDLQSKLATKTQELEHLQKETKQKQEELEEEIDNLEEEIEQRDDRIKELLAEKLVTQE